MEPTEQLGIAVPNLQPTMSLKDMQLALLGLQIPQQLQMSLVRLCIETEQREEKAAMQQFSQRTLVALCVSLMTDNANVDDANSVLSGDSKVRIDHEVMVTVQQVFKERGMPVVHYEEDDAHNGFISLHYVKPSPDSH